MVRSCSRGFHYASQVCVKSIWKNEINRKINQSWGFAAVQKSGLINCRWGWLSGLGVAVILCICCWKWKMKCKIAKWKVKEKNISRLQCVDYIVWWSQLCVSMAVTVIWKQLIKQLRSRLTINSQLKEMDIVVKFKEWLCSKRDDYLISEMEKQQSVAGINSRVDNWSVGWVGLSMLSNELEIFTKLSETKVEQYRCSLTR